MQHSENVLMELWIKGVYLDIPRLNTSFAVLILFFDSMCKAYDMKKIECACPILFASRKLYMTSASAQFSACNDISDPLLKLMIQQLIVELGHKNMYELYSVSLKQSRQNERHPHIPTTLLGNEDHSCSGLHAKMYAHIVHKSQPVLSSLHQEEKPPGPIWCTFRK